MAESYRPTAAAVVADPILNLWPAYSMAGRLAAVRAFLTAPMNLHWKELFYLASERGLLGCYLI